MKKSAGALPLLLTVAITPRRVLVVPSSDLAPVNRKLVSEVQDLHRSG